MARRVVVCREILRLRSGSATAETFVRAGVDTNTAGLIADTARGVLWTCAVDLHFLEPTALRAFDLETGRLRAQYGLPDRCVCADITLGRGAVYLTDTTDPTAATQPPARILRLTTPRPANLSSGELFRVPIRYDGSASPARAIDLDRALVQPDGIRMSIAIARGGVWGTEGQVWRLLSGQPAVLPFRARRFPSLPT